MAKPPAFRDPNRVLLGQVPRRSRSRGNLLWLLTCLAGFALFFWLSDHGHFWLAMGALGLLVGAGAIFVFAGGRAWQQQIALDDARADELAADFSDDFEVRGELAWGWPVIITLLLLLFATIAWGTRFSLNPATWVAAGLLAATIAAWTLALQLHRVRARFTAEGLDIQGKYIPWRGVLSINPEVGLLLPGTQRWSSVARLSFRLNEPLSPLEIPGGLFSGVSLDHSGRVILISLARTAETPSVVFQLATDLWQKARLK
jgi:hypothetical protein